RRRRDEDGHAVGDPLARVLGRVGREEAQGPAPAPRVLDKDDLAEETLLLPEDRTHDTVRRRVQPPRERESLEQRVPPRDDPGADGPLGEPPDRHQDQDQEEQAESGNVDADRRIYEIAEKPVEALEDPPEHDRGDGDRCDHDEPGDQVTLQGGPAHRASTSRRIASWRCHISLSSLSSPSGCSYPSTCRAPCTARRASSSRG